MVSTVVVGPGMCTYDMEAGRTPFRKYLGEPKNRLLNFRWPVRSADRHVTSWASDGLGDVPDALSDEGPRGS